MALTELEKLELEELELEEQLLESRLKEQEPTPAESLVRQGLRLATSGFSDELLGEIEGAGQRIGIKGLGGPIADTKFFQEIPTDQEIEQSKKQAKQRERQAFETDFKVNPKSSFTGAGVGILANPLNKFTGGLSKGLGGGVPGFVAGAGVQGLAGGAGESTKETALGVAGDAALTGGLSALATQAIGSAGKLISQKINPTGFSAFAQIRESLEDFLAQFGIKANADEILKAARELGVEPTPGMLSSSVFLQRLEDNLSKSPSIFGATVRKTQEAVAEAIKKTVDDIAEEGSGLSRSEAGEQFKSDFVASIGERLDPIAAGFQSVADSTKAIPISKKAVDTIIRNIQNLPSFRLTGGAGKPGQFVEYLKRAENANDIKTTVSLLNAEIKGAASGIERNILSQMKEKLLTLEKNSVIRAAIQTAKEAGKSLPEKQAKEIAGDLLSELGTARKGYRALSTQIKESGEKVFKPDTNPYSAVDIVEQIPSENILDKFFNVNNIRQLNALRQNFGAEFDNLRRAKISQITDKAESLGSEIIPSKFFNNVRKLQPEVKDLIFQNQVGKINQAQKVQANLTPNFNMSGTAAATNFRDVITSNLTDAPSFFYYKAAQSPRARKIAEALIKETRFSTLFNSSPNAFAQLVQEMLTAQDPITQSIVQRIQQEADNLSITEKAKRLNEERKVLKGKK